MTCYNPTTIYLRKSFPINKPDEDTLHELNTPKFSYRKNYYEVKVPCGKCEGCKLDHANEWATRIFCEMKYHKEACFVTLTYNNEKLPINDKGYPTLKKRDVQLFFKRLSKKYPNIRKLYCGEMGPKTHRPHYHCIILGYKPKDLKVYKTNHKEQILWKSKELQKIWGKGFVVIGDCNYETACYVARYVQKKAGIEKRQTEYYYDIFGKKRRKYIKVNETGQEPEFIEMSRKPGIGYQYWQDNKELIKQQNGILVKCNDKIILKKLPRYYKKLWEAENWEEYHQNKYNQCKKAEQQIQNILDQISIEASDDKKWEWYINNQKESIEFKAKLLKRTNII